MEALITQYKKMINKLLKNTIFDFGSELSANLPQKPGVYRIFEKGNPEKAIYIGKSKNLKNRVVGDHYKGDRIASTLKRKLIRGMGLSDEKEVMDYLSNKCSVQFIITENKQLQTGFEHFAVAVLTPKWND